jgi:23S rRNA pseudouridine1911/1915/1917 synthase
MQFQSFIVKEEQAGQRLDQFMADSKNESRSLVQKWIKQSRVQINEATVSKPSQKVAALDEVKLRLIKPRKSKHDPQDIPLDIVFENKDYIVLNKDPGIVVHPDQSGHADGTIVNAILAHNPDIEGVGDQLRPGIVHRLDKDTSGALIIAKNQKTHQRLSKHFQDRSIHKEYIALVKGHPESTEGTIDAAIKRDRVERKRMAINPQGKNAKTHFKLLANYKNSSLLAVKIETGRTHQIRLHMASIGHPVVGDSVYGDTKINKKFYKEYGLKRQFLHSKSLSFEEVSYEAPLKKDLQKVLDQLEED